MRPFHQDLLGDHATSSFCFDVLQDGKREAFREAGRIVRSGVIVHVISTQMCTQPYVCYASVSAALGLSEIRRRLLWPGRGLWFQSVFKTDFGCNGLGLPPLWLFALCRLGFITKLCALDSGSATSMSPLSMSSSASNISCATLRCDH